MSPPHRQASASLRSRQELLARKTNDILSTPDGSSQAEEVLRFLKDWWLDHIGGEDRDSVPCLAEAFRQARRPDPVDRAWYCPGW